MIVFCILLLKYDFYLLFYCFILFHFYKKKIIWGQNILNCHENKVILQNIFMVLK